jgi:valyl-tRNA synthetase
VSDPYRIVSSPVRLPGVVPIAQLSAMVSVDALCRRARSRGSEAEWVSPSLAGDLAGQHATERELAREGLDRATLGREAFVARVRDYEADARARLGRLLGSLCIDADIDAGAIDREPVARAAATAFVRLFEQGRLALLERVVDTCPRCEPVVDGVDAEPGAIPVDAVLVDLELVAGLDPLRVAIIAPELLPGVIAVAVPEDHPAVGDAACLPLTGREVPVIADVTAERPRLIVPAHDVADHELARQRSLTAVDVLDGEGVVRAQGPLEGLSRYAARTAAVQLLTDAGTIVGVEPMDEPVSRCRRCGTVLVPRLGRHWFLGMGELEEAAADAVRDAGVSFAPPSARDDFLARAVTGGDWCLSHQVWAGQPAPVSRCLDCGQVAVTVESQASCGKCMGLLAPDDSVLDARFVGAVAFLAAAGWPEDETGPARVAPVTTFLVGPNGLSRWALPVAALGVRLAGAVPFQHVAVQEVPEGEVAPDELEELIERDGARVIRAALMLGGLETEAARELVELVDDPPVGQGLIDDLVTAWEAAFDAATPRVAVDLVAGALAAGVAPGEDERIASLTAPLLGDC